MKKIQIISPSDCITGGPDALHDLCSRLNILGFEASILYFPNTNSKIPEQYSSYQFVKKESTVSDTPDTLIIIPEVLCGLANKFVFAKICIWWLSVDNYLNPRASLKDLYRYIRDCLVGEKSFVRMLKKHNHISQSHYAYEFLLKNGVNSYKIYEPISTKFYSKDLVKNDRKNKILYNPKKGSIYTEKLIKLMDGYEFVPLINFKADELLNLFHESKIYIDFGNHPGRDRIPRESVINGCCLITSQFGSAHNNFDIPIPEKFKFDIDNASSYSKIRNLIFEIFKDYDNYYNEFTDYKNIIINDFNSYESILKKYFDNLCS